MRARLTIAAALLTAAVLGCGDGDGNERSCVPGSTQVCRCEGAKLGVQICKLDGSDWKECQCDGDADSDADTDTDTDADTDTNPSDIAVSPLSIEFGVTAVGVPISDTVLASSTGGQALVISRVEEEDTSHCFEYSCTHQGSDCSFPLQMASGEFATFTVTYTPTSVGGHVGTVSLYTNVTIKPVIHVGLTGSGT